MVLLAVGTCTIDANQAGDATYGAAAQVSRSFAVTASGGEGGAAQMPTGRCSRLTPPARVRATATPLGRSTRGDVSWFTVVKWKNGRVVVRTYGVPIRLSITLWAGATNVYAAYRATRVYRLR